MRDLHNSFLSVTFLRSVWGQDYEAFKGSAEENTLAERLCRWAARADLKETSAEAALIEVFFRQTWDYHQTGQIEGKMWHAFPQYPIKGAGPRGGPGEADLALGYFTGKGCTQVPQVICEFKDIKTSLDAPQKSRKDGLSPIKQGMNYLSKARRGIAPGEPVVSQWAIATDMNEFRLYWHDRGTQQYLGFTIRRPDLFSDGMVNSDGSVPDDDDARFERFLFWKIFHRETLITSVGKPRLVQLIERQWVKERQIERDFYQEYRALRETLIDTIIEENPHFQGTKGRMVRIAQKILDRCIFIFFCEDMGAALRYPPQLLRDFLIERSRDSYFDPDGDSIWRDLVRLFKAMNTGAAFGPHQINQFNGGLFADDEDLESLTIPNRVFCQSGQGANEASLYAHKLTFLFLSASYNYAGGWAEGLTKPAVGDSAKDIANKVKADPDQSLGLYMLGRIFEQSITELEILEAQYEGRPSVNDLSKRKRDGVYYTPEWVVERIVTETLEPILKRFKKDAGWPHNKNPNEAQIATYAEKLQELTVVDPACGSGAFLITALRYLLDEIRALQDLRFEVTGKARNRDDDELVRDILRSNIYGTDINAASVEIARLALWLHTARGNKPLSSLEGTIKEGNSLIGQDFYKGQIELALYDEEERERINAFDWEAAYPEVFARGGFDAVVGNPPYVKLQNFRKVHEDMARYLKEGRPDVDEVPGYKSAKTGNFDLYLPFIEKGLNLLNPHGRLGYIAPSVWVVNEYGKGLRELISKGKNLHRWLDFKSHQIFDEATVYTALQFFSKEENKAVEIAYAPDGSVPGEPWADPSCALPVKQLEFGERWLLITGPERALIDKLAKSCKRLDDASLTTSIFQGLITSADHIYHLKRIGLGRYLHDPKGKDEPPYEVEIEDALMKPLVSGVDAKRYQTPAVETFILFPYEERQGTVRLIEASKMQDDYPKAWKHLTSYEDALREREATLDKNGGFKLTEKGEPEKAPFNDHEWYRFGRHQGMGMQECVKLLVPRLVTNLSCFADPKGTFYLDNVDAGGVATCEDVDPFFIAGILNSPTANFVFRRISKPFRGDYLSANKQFIAPLPIPEATSEQQADIANRARSLQEAHTALRIKVAALARRTSDMPSKSRPEAFLFPSVVPAKVRAENAPTTLEKAKKREWAISEYHRDIQDRMVAINQRLTPEATLEAALKDGELSLQIDGVPVIDHVYLEVGEGELVAAQWKAVVSTFTVSGINPAKKLCNALRKLVITTNEAQIKQIIKLQSEITDLETTISAQECEINAQTYKLYKLTDDEIKLVEKG